MFMAAASVLLAPGVASANPGNDGDGRGRPGYHAPHGDDQGNGQDGGQGYGQGGGYGHGSGHYPAPPASVAVSAGTVHAGKAVRVTGNGFGRHELVVVQTRYRPATQFWFPRQGIVIGQQTVHTDNHGRFSAYTQTWLPGKIRITARGLRSGKTGSATVKVLPRGHHPIWGGGLWGAGESGTPSGTVAVSHATPAPGQGDNAPLYLLTITVVALTGSTLMTRRFTRHRRAGTP
jgi:hypothetical protein